MINSKRDWAAAGATVEAAKPKMQSHAAKTRGLGADTNSAEQFDVKAFLYPAWRDMVEPDSRIARANSIFLPNFPRLFNLMRCHN